MKLPPLPVASGVAAASAINVTAFALVLVVPIALLSVRSPLWVRTSTNPVAEMPMVELSKPMVNEFESE